MQVPKTRGVSYLCNIHSKDFQHQYIVGSLSIICTLSRKLSMWCLISNNFPNSTQKNESEKYIDPFSYGQNDTEGNRLLRIKLLEKEVKSPEIGPLHFLFVVTNDCQTEAQGSAGGKSRVNKFDCSTRPLPQQALPQTNPSQEKLHQITPAI